MQRQNAGKTVKEKYLAEPYVGQTFEAFVPSSLPPQPPLQLSGALRQLQERAQTAIGELNSIDLLLPNANLFLYMYVRKEALLSSQIEGTQSSFSDLLRAENGEKVERPEDALEVSNYIKALNHGLRRIREDNMPICLRLIREIHENLLSTGRGSDKSPGVFRTHQNWIGGDVPWRSVFIPPPAKYLTECLGHFEAFLNDGDVEYSVLIQAALAHVQFETLHPFYDGNGRVGRLLITLMLCSAGLLREPMLYLSLYFKSNRDTYYDLLDHVRKTGDWERWVDFFLRGVLETCSSATQTTRRLQAALEEDREAIRNSKKKSYTLPSIHEALSRRPVTGIKEISEKTGLSFPTVNKNMGHLESLGIVKEITGRAKNRQFRYEKYMNILEEGAEPLPE